MGNIPVTTTTKSFSKVLRYKWGAYCKTNGRRTAIQMGGVLTEFPFPQRVGAPKVLRCELEAYCNYTNWRRIAILFREVVVVGVSDIVLTTGSPQKGYPWSGLFLKFSLRNYCIKCLELEKSSCP